jgi:hypothetical protein
MKNPPALANDPFRRADPVAAAAADASALETREGRIAVLAWVADQLIASADRRMKFVGSALKAGLEEGKHVGDLERRFLRIAGGQGCTTSPAQILRRIRRA